MRIARRCLRDIVFVLAALPGAVLGLGTVVLAAAGVVTAPLGIGIVLLAVALAGARSLARVRRVLYRRLSGRDWGPVARTSGSGPLRAAVTDLGSWRALGYAAASFPVLAVAGYAVLLTLVGGLFLVTAPAWWWVSHDGWGLLDAGSFGRTWLVVPVGVVALTILPAAARLGVLSDTGLARLLLSPDRELARIRELESRRTAIADDNVATLRRVERELHDGTQAALVAIGVTVSRARSRVNSLHESAEADSGRLDEVDRLLDTAGSSVTTALDQLRGIVRRLRPPALDDGLAVAVHTLIAHSGLPVDSDIAVSAEPSDAASTAVYFAAAELLSNVTRHADAQHVRVVLSDSAGRLMLQVVDDGTGGATVRPHGAHTGLAGLDTRIAALDGTMVLESPAGGPTRVQIEIPSTRRR